MTEEKKEKLAHNNYPYGSEMPIGSKDRSLYENKKESFLNGLNTAINYTHCCKSDSELLCDKNEYGQIKKLYIRVGNEWVEQKKQ